MKTTIACLAAALALFAPAAHAVQIAAFGQTSGSNTLHATVNGADTITTLAVSNATVNVTQLFDHTPIDGLDLNLNAHSIDPVTGVGPALLQHYAGTFCITSAPGCGGLNVLSGNFSDAAFGAKGGPGLVVQVSNPPDTLAFTSGVLPAKDLIAPNSLNFGFSNLTPLLGSIGTTIAPFTASLAGTASASAASVVEPGALSLFLVGLGGLAIGVRRRPT